MAPMLDIIANQTVAVGDNVTFTCTILLSDTQPQLQWFQHYSVNGSEKDSDGDPYVYVLQVLVYINTEQIFNH